MIFVRNVHFIYRRLQINTIGRHCKFSTTLQEERDPGPVFINKDVQKLLKILTRPDLKKIYRQRKDGTPISAPQYKFMTDEELQEAFRKAREKVYEKLQMPPVVQKRKPITGILSKDPEIQGNDTAKYVFTDITYGVSSVDRLIVVRDPEGVLRHANWDERFRMNQTYFPIEGREINPPKMFQDEYLKDLLKREEYEFVLDRACLQYDPDDPEFHRVTSAVYEAVNEKSQFKKLRSTRHYGPMVFYLTWNKNIDNLLLENITNGLIEDAALLVKLYNTVNPSSKAADITHEGDDLKFIQQFIELESPIRGKLQAAIHAYKELEEARKKVDQGVKEAHGIE
ncbi:28S ribosomal protein S22, mitochondrial [Microplitis mediator]|uniref:28S ribosomal protein S22, mitochondrial n=1 Tax=Microplitis mediator TaxID=375433 RepID=UPI002556BC6C|nr:28S ribosomal protein S22, mitochondrial [Microplitis mediator]